MHVRHAWLEIAWIIRPEIKKLGRELPLTK